MATKSQDGRQNSGWTTKWDFDRNSYIHCIHVRDEILKDDIQSGKYIKLSYFTNM